MAITVNSPPRTHLHTLSRTQYLGGYVIKLALEADIFASTALFDKTYNTAFGKNWRLQRCLLDVLVRVTFRDCFLLKKTRFVVFKLNVKLRLLCLVITYNYTRLQLRTTYIYRSQIAPERNKLD